MAARAVSILTLRTLTARASARLAAPPPPFVFPPPPPVQFDEEWRPVALEPSSDPFRGRTSAYVKRIANARMPNPSLRSSAHTVSCPGHDDCSDACGRVCAGRHLNALRSFAVTGEHWVQRQPPRPASPPPVPVPPSPPFSPFSSCMDSCTLPPLRDWEKERCRDGGRGSYRPTLCFYSTQCQFCGIRDPSPTIEQNDECDYSQNGRCEDGGAGSVYFTDAAGQDTHLCGLGTDATDCAALGAREVLSLGFESYAGVTNVAFPRPPPVPPPPPAPVHPPPSTSWLAFPDEANRCYSFFRESDRTFLCSGTEAQIADKKRLELCTMNLQDYKADEDVAEYCSDGGFDSVVIHKGEIGYAAPRFGCDYGSSDCAHPREFETWITTGRGCVPKLKPREQPTTENGRGGCADVCGVGEKGDPIELYHSSDSASDGTAFCRDGGADAETATCNYGTQCTRCGFRKIIYKSTEQRRGLDGLASGKQGNFARRRLQSDYDLGIAPSPPPPPPPAGKGTGLFNTPLPPPSPRPPPPPPHSPPPSPCPSPSPPPTPPGYYSHGRCHCFTASDYEGREWSEMELRAKANYVDESAVTYLARSSLVRGKSNFTKPIVWVPGGSPPLHVSKWVDSAALEGQIAHLVDGWRPARPGMVLEKLDLEYFNGVRPAWWPSGDSTWQASPNNTHDTAFWASVCASACFRDHRDDVRVVLVELDSYPACCTCYAWEDAEGVDTHPSHSAPSDAQLLRFLEGASRAPGARPRTSLYAVGEKVSAGHYWGAMQSTVYHAQVLSTEYTHGAPGAPSKQVAAATLQLCLEECGTHTGLALNTVSWVPSTPMCSCYEADFGLASHGTSWRPRGAGEPPTFYYRARFCRNVRATSERSLVYSKVDDRTCPGVPVVTGFTLATHALMQTVSTSEADSSSIPFDVRCENLCAADSQCAISHAFVPTFDVHDLANRNPPPPSPPEPPSQPPPMYPPLPPFPPAPPPSERSGWRMWAPSALLAPRYDQKLDAYVITCQVEGCHEPIAVWESPNQVATSVMARRLMQNGVFERSVCPFECARGVVRHGLAEDEESNVLSGVGLTAAAFQYSGHAESSVGVSTFAVRAAGVGAAAVQTLWRETGISLDHCDREISKRRNLCPHGLWVHTSTSQLGFRGGDCSCHLGARSKLQAAVLRAFFEHARQITDLEHFRWTHDDVSVAATSPSDGAACDGDLSRVCVFWSEFSLDEGSELGCFPSSEGDNVVTPQVLLEAMQEASVGYPPPSPPPP